MIEKYLLLLLINRPSYVHFLLTLLHFRTSYILRLFSIDEAAAASMTITVDADRLIIAPLPKVDQSLLASVVKQVGVISHCLEEVL